MQQVSYGPLMSIMIIMSCYRLGSLTCEEGGNLSTRALDFIYVSSEGRVGCEFMLPAHNRRMPLQETIGPISISPGSRGVGSLMRTSASRKEKPAAYSTPLGVGAIHMNKTIF